MSVFVVLCRSFRAVGLIGVAGLLTALSTPAEARTHHGGRSVHHHHVSHHHHSSRHAYRHHGRRHADRHAYRLHGARWSRRLAVQGAQAGFAAPASNYAFDQSSAHYSSYPAAGVSPSRVSRTRLSRAERRASFLNANASMGSSGGGFGGGSDIVATARRYIGGNPTGRSSLWCARFMNMVLQRSGHRGTGSDMASSFAHYGQRISGPQVGAIAVMSRGRRGGHVGVVSGIDPRGNPIVVSGNHGRRVAESVYSRGRVYAYVMPN
jgi:uncharacterized protein (TIGR02594 family)